MAESMSRMCRWGEEKIGGVKNSGKTTGPVLFAAVELHRRFRTDEPWATVRGSVTDDRWTVGPAASRCCGCGVEFEDMKRKMIIIVLRLLALVYDTNHEDGH